MDEPLKRERETARQRALRIPLDYHRTRGALWAWRLGLTLACLLVGGSYLVWVVAGGTPAVTQVSPGTLARDHARWDSDCKACHVPFVPQRPDADGARMVSLSLKSGDSKKVHSQSDAKCSACHKSAGTHDANQIVSEVESCASCHRDHQGRDFHMARMDDAHCTDCHASIAGHRTSQGSPVSSPIVNVTAFEPAPPDTNSGHPPFRSLQKQEDPGNIRFSHRLHMTLGQLYPGQVPPTGKRLEQLACDACHQSETTTGNGAYMQPIKYEQHCRRCHPLSIPGQNQPVIPHGLTSQQLEDVVKSRVVSELKNPAALPSPQRQIPGKYQESNPAGNLDPPPEMLFRQRLEQLRENKCQQCHSWQSQNPMPARIPTTWLKHARFNHQKHQNSAKCLDCHAQAGAKLPSSGISGKLTDDQQIMIPGIDNCVRCHAPRNETANTGGARFDCAECHQYHHPPVQEKPLRKNARSSASAADWPKSLRLTLVAHQKGVVSPLPKHSFVGAQSCSTTGCHGATTNDPGSSSSFTRFTANDPHERAFLLLYSDSSRRIIRRLRGEDQPELSEPGYFSAIQEKCLGCHATPPSEPAKSNQLEGYLSGITCESCHGAAAEWEFTHFRRGTKPSSLSKLSELSSRAGNCAECHIGPKQMLGKTYDVNHDLIAAGHPRLTFEFEAQLANLPAHWSPTKNVKSHFEAWRLGELATASQQDKLFAGRNELEFASHRCFDCHHGLTPNPATSRAKFPPLAVISKEQRELLAGSTPAKREQTAILLKLLSMLSDDGNKTSAGTHWEEHVHFSLALSAFAVGNPQSGELTKHVVSLNEILANSFRSLPSDRKLQKGPFLVGSQYDSPTGFNPKDERVKKVIDNIRACLTAP